MFFKWRTYQRQFRGEKQDKYFLQPIIVNSYRVSKKQTRADLIKNGTYDGKEWFHAAWALHRYDKPKHEIIYRLPSFVGCMYVYLNDPEQIKNRRRYWKNIEMIFFRLLLTERIKEADARKLLDELDSILPCPQGLKNVVSNIWDYKNIAKSEGADQ